MKYVMMNIDQYQRTQRKIKTVDRCMLYVIYIASLAVPIYLFRIGFDSFLINIRGGY